MADIFILGNDSALDTNMSMFNQSLLFDEMNYTTTAAAPAPTPRDIEAKALLFKGVMTIPQFVEARRIMRCFVNPLLCSVGITTNTASLVVISRDGLQKSSNLLLFGLAFADLIYTAVMTNIPDLVFFFSAERGFHFSHSTNLFLYYMYHAKAFGKLAFSLISITIPVFITFERLIALFFPLKFNLIVTRQRTIFVLVAIYAVWIIRSLPVFLEKTYVYRGDTMLFVTNRVIVREDWHLFISNLSVYVSGIGFLVVVLVGTIVIGIKVSIVSQQRKKMSASSTNPEKTKKGTSRTTKTLLSVCVLYSVSNLIIYVFDQLRIYDNYASMVSYLLYELTDSILIINSSCNFFIYIFFNNKFRQHLSFRSSRNSTAVPKKPA